MAGNENNDFDDISPTLEVPLAVVGDEKGQTVDMIEVADGKDETTVNATQQGIELPPDVRRRVARRYGDIAEKDAIATRNDIDSIIERIAAMSEQEAYNIVLDTIEYHKDDPNFPSETMKNLRFLIQDSKLSEMDDEERSIELRTEAAIFKYHSPYPEVRSVTDPYDEPAVPVETLRAYFIGMCLMGGCTALNTFFSPRQPQIIINSTVLQLLLAPCGLFCARVLPDWGFNFRGKRITLNPGPWTYKEQSFATILFTVSNQAGSVYYVYLVQRLPQYLNQSWAGAFSYEIVLALGVQLYGFGFAGLLRRYVVYPVTAIWPKVLPVLALNRALVKPEKKESINGWRLTRYQYFIGAAILMFIWFWVPNTLFTALHAFNWMTWIAPNNFNLGMITGFYGGMGFNPWATFDWNVAGTTYLVTPWWSAIQQYGARVLSGLIIIAMYWTNEYWSAYMPINSNEAFNNKGEVYNVTVVSDGHGGIDRDAYKSYGPPYFSGANVFGQGAWFAWYPLTIFYITIKYWDAMKRSAHGMWRSLRYRESCFEGNNDAHSRMMRVYKEVPDWWYFAILIGSMIFGIAAISHWPTETPWWTVPVVAVMSLLLLVPSAILLSVANVTMGFNVLFQLLAGVWFPGNAEAQIIVVAFGSNFDAQSTNFVEDLKLAHYAKLPPRAVFRGQIIAAILNTFIFIGMLNWMITHFDNGTLCEWDNAQHFVCTDAVLVFASAVEYGAFGVKNMFKLYPILPWCFLMGSLIGLIWGLCHRYGPYVQDIARRRWTEKRFDTWNRYFFNPLGMLNTFDPAVCWSGALNWTGGNNLSYATNGVYISFIFMYYLKRNYNAWWSKYNYITEAAFDVGVAISAIIQTLALDLNNSVTINWWGNTVSTAGVDYRSYNQNSSLLPIPDVGYFGLPPEKYPMDF